MYLTGVSIRRIETASEIIRGLGVAAPVVSNLNERVLALVEYGYTASTSVPTPTSTSTAFI